MEPIPETRDVLEELERFGSEGHRERLLAMGQQARSIVPECVGLSLGALAEGLTFTLVASSEDIATLDAVQYLDGGPCVLGSHEAVTVNVDRVDELESKWQMFAASSSAAGIASTLTMPIVENDRVVGTVNLYAATPHAFDGHHEALADALGTSAALAVSNADLSFSTRIAAAEAPQQLSEKDEINIIVGVISASQDVDFGTARERLRMAAARGGVSELQVARALHAILLG